MIVNSRGTTRVNLAFVVQVHFMTNQVPGFTEITEWPVSPSTPLRIGDFGIYRDPDPHCTMYVDLVDSDGNVFNFFFDRFLGRLCFGKIDDNQDAAFLKKGSRIQTEAFTIIKNLCDGREEYKEIQSRLELARNYV